MKELAKSLGERTLARLAAHPAHHRPGERRDRATSCCPPAPAGGTCGPTRRRRSYKAELGLTLPSGEFRRFAESNTVVTPRVGPSPAAGDNADELRRSRRAFPRDAGAAGRASRTPAARGAGARPLERARRSTGTAGRRVAVGGRARRRRRPGPRAGRATPSSPAARATSTAANRGPPCPSGTGAPSSTPTCRTSATPSTRSSSRRTGSSRRSPRPTSRSSASSTACSRTASTTA